MLIKKPYQNEDIPGDFFIVLSKIPHSYRDLHEMHFYDAKTLVINHPYRILISLNRDIMINVYESGMIIIHNCSIIQLSNTGNLTITM